MKLRYILICYYYTSVWSITPISFVCFFTSCLLSYFWMIFLTYGQCDQLSYFLPWITTFYCFFCENGRQAIKVIKIIPLYQNHSFLGNVEKLVVRYVVVLAPKLRFGKSFAEFFDVKTFTSNQNLFFGS